MPSPSSRRGPTPVEQALESLEEIGARPEPNRLLELTLLVTRAWLEAMKTRASTSRET